MSGAARALLLWLLALGGIACDDRLRLALTIQSSALAPAARDTVTRLEIDVDAPAQEKRYTPTVELGTTKLAETERIIIELPQGTGEVTVTARALAGAIELAMASEHASPRPGALVGVTIVLGVDGGGVDGGTGTFSVAPKISTGVATPRVAIGDLDGQPGDELVLSDGVTLKVAVLAHAGAPQYFAVPVSRPILVQAEALAIGNLFGTSAAQLVVVGASGGNAKVYVHDSAVSIPQLNVVSFAITGAITSAMIGPLLDSGGKPVPTVGVTATGTTMLVSANAAGALVVGAGIASTGAQRLALTQLDQGRGDVLIAENGLLGFCQDQDPMAAGCSQSIIVSGELTSVFAADFNRDGLLDVIVGSSGSSSAVHFLQNLAMPLPGDLGASSASLVENAAHQLAGGTSPVVADFNGDGYPDLAYIESSGDRVRVVYLTGSVEMSHEQIALGLGLSVLVVANLDLDGKPDLVAIDAQGNVWPIVHAM